MRFASDGNNINDYEAKRNYCQEHLSSGQAICRVMAWNSVAQRRWTVYVASKHGFHQYFALSDSQTKSICVWNVLEKLVLHPGIVALFWPQFLICSIAVPGLFMEVFSSSPPMISTTRRYLVICFTCYCIYTFLHCTFVLLMLVI